MGTKMGNHPELIRHIHPASAARQRGTLGAIFIAAVLVAGVLSGCGKKDAAPAPVATPAAVSTTNPPPLAAPKPEFQKLKGKWLRPDGGYIIEIKSVDGNGKLEAAYLNPKPIHVAKAEASRDGAAVKVFIELRDVNYPGSTYKLIYVPENDQLSGIYYQALQQQSFEVVFVRSN